jgi:hypothetical protein
VREHGAEGAVAYYADVGKFCPVLFVDYEAAFVVDFEADVFETETSGVGAATNGYEDDVCVKLGSEVSFALFLRMFVVVEIAYSLFFAALCSFDFELHALAASITFEYLGVKLELHALLL